MTMRANTRLIGAFVVGALLLAAAGIVLFGSGQWFKEKVTTVMYFDGSVNGLDVGAPVKLRGVTVGSVTRIELVLDEHRRMVLIRVFAELEPSHIYTPAGTLTRLSASSRADALRKGIEQFGLHASLEMQSLLTGKLFVELNADTNVQARRHAMKALDEDIVEIPTVPSTSEQVMEVIKKAAKHLGELPMGEILDDIRASIAALRRILTSAQLTETLDSVHSATARLDALLATLNERVTPVLANLQEAAGRTARLSETLEREAPPTAAALREASERVASLAQHAEPALVQLLARLQDLVDQMAAVARHAGRLVRGDSPLQTELIDTLQETRRAARALREFAEYLERHPEALLRGRR